jgi:hypothetical protein
MISQRLRSRSQCEEVGDGQVFLAGRLRRDSVRQLDVRLGDGVPSLIVAAAVVVALGAGAMAADGGPQPGPRAALDLSRTVALAERVVPDQAAAFAVLRGARRQTDEIPAATRALIGDSHVSGRNTTLSRAIETRDGTGWVVPGNGTICLAVPDSVDGVGVTCSNTDFVAAYGMPLLSIAAARPDAVELTALVPDGGEIEVAYASGARRTLRPDASGVVSSVITGATGFRVRTPSGAKDYPMPAPPPAAPTSHDCGDGRILPAAQPCA